MKIEPCLPVGGEGVGAGEACSSLGAFNSHGSPRIPGGAIIAYQHSLVEFAAFDFPSRFEGKGGGAFLEEDDEEFFAGECFDMHRIFFEEVVWPGFRFTVVFHTKDEPLPVLPDLRIVFFGT